MGHGVRGRKVSRIALVATLVGAMSGVVVIGAGSAGAAREPLVGQGTVQCAVSGKAKFAAPLLPTAQAGRAVSIKADLSCTVGQTGDSQNVVTAGKLALVSRPFAGSCSAPNPTSVTGAIKWRSTGSKIVSTNITLGAPSGTATNPYGYNFASVSATGSYGGESGAFRVTSTTTRAACGQKGIKVWPITGSFTLHWGPPLVATAISAGETNTCAALPSGVVKCWGSGVVGGSHRPTTVSGFSGPVTAVTAETWHMCGLTTSGAVQCLGLNEYGELGDGTDTRSTVPVQVSGLTSGVTAIASTYGTTCAIASGGALKCWGANSNGQLGNGTKTRSNVPVQVSGLTSGVVAVAIGPGAHTCAVLDTGIVKCWGANDASQLGVPGDGSSHTVPVQVGNLTGAVDVSVGYNHSCALLNTGAVKCWGSDAAGQVGDGSVEPPPPGLPQQVVGLTSGVVAISAGTDHNCAVLSTGAVRCWGNNFYGKLGIGGNTGISSAAPYPVAVSGLSSGAVDVSAGNNHTCARLASGGVRCWGNNDYGQLGNGAEPNSFWPVTVVT